MDDTERTSADPAAATPDDLPHQTDGADAAGGAARRAAEAAAVRRTADRPSHPAVEGHQTDGPPRPS
jgi:hypothetical protein